MAFRSDIRAVAVRLLAAAGTLAGTRVQSSRDTDVVREDLPFLGVYATSEHKTSASMAGTAPLFEATLTLHVDCRVGRAVLADAESDLDTLIDQVQTALLTNPAFYMPTPAGSTVATLVRRISSVTVETKFDGHSDVHLGQAVIGFGIDYYDLYPLGPFPELSGIDLTVAPNGHPIAAVTPIVAPVTLPQP